DTAAAADTAAIPVPAPTQPLGARPGHAIALPESLTAPPAAPPPAAAPAAPDTCFRVQIGAPSARARGKRLRDASESLLVAPMVVDHDRGRWKVRTRDCLSRAAAEALRARALASGFRGAFVLHQDTPK
ncbi:MAG TPA: SPOR domain-containing protein, partial [Candidatus Eisenbacteria bacterium]|nr:SPOR domain-containing protein [Candidatus Eisenbacteria bacterium]